MTAGGRSILHRQTERYDQVELLLEYYRALRERTQSVNIVDPSCDLGGYKFIVAPSLNIISKDLGHRLEEFVKKGGYLLLGPRSGLKDEFSGLNIERQPGPLVAALGGRVEQYYALIDDVPVSNKVQNGPRNCLGGAISTSAPDAEVMLKYGAGNGWLEGDPTTVVGNLGMGEICYVGAVLDLPLMRGDSKGHSDSAGVEAAPDLLLTESKLCRRVGVGHEVFVLINHGNVANLVRLPSPMTDVINGGLVENISISPKDVVVVDHTLSGALK